jgi:hypothetical protein
MTITTRLAPMPDDTDARKEFIAGPVVAAGVHAPDSADADAGAASAVQETESGFMYLSLELPPTPLFKDGQDRNFIPQVPLPELLHQFDGATERVRRVVARGIVLPLMRPFRAWCTACA